MGSGRAGRSNASARVWLGLALGRSGFESWGVRRMGRVARDAHGEEVGHGRLSMRGVRGNAVDKFQIVDCTLREGEQTPGVWWSPDEKLALLDRLADAGIAWLDAGMPEVGEEERDFFRRALGRTSARILASVRLKESSVRLAFETGCDGVFLICPCSPIHRERRLGVGPAELRRRVRGIVRMAAAAGGHVFFVAEDSVRTPVEELGDLLRTALDAGAEVLFLCDTVGMMLPSSMRAHIEAVRGRVGADVPLGVHCHNDFGLATANTLSAVEAGVRWPTTCVNGIGERSGNASLAEVVLALERLMGHRTGVRLDALSSLAREVEHLSGMIRSPHQPVTGRHAFRHESGIHVDGVLKDAETYEVLSPSLLGREREFVFGKHSGRALVRHVAAQEGLRPSEEAIEATVAWLKTRRPKAHRARFRALRASLDVYEAEAFGVSRRAVVNKLRAMSGEGDA